MQEIKSIICDDINGETLWEGILLPAKKNYEGFIYSTVSDIYINFEYFGCDVRMTVKHKSLINDFANTDSYYLALVNDTGLTEWFTTSGSNIVICTRENVSNGLAETYRKKLNKIIKNVR